MSGSISKIPILIITLVIGFIMVTTAVLPLAADYSEAKTFTNEGYYELEEITENSASIIVWNYTAPKSLTINGETITPNMPVNKPVTIYGSDKIVVRYLYVSDSNARVQVYTASGYLAASVGDSTSMTITVSGMGVSVTNGTATREVTSDSGYFISLDGEYTMKNADEPVFIHKSDSIIVFSGITNVSSDVGLFGVGTIDDGMNISYVPTSSSTPTVSFGDVEFNYSNVNGYRDLVSLSDCQFEINNNGTTGTATYSYFIVPEKVTADPDNPDTFKNMVRIVPLIALVALVAAAAGMIYFKGKE